MKYDFRLQLVVVIGSLFLSAYTLNGSNLPTGFAESTIPGPNAGNWNEAAGLTFESNGRMYVWERGGTDWFKEPGDTSFTQLLNINEEVGAWEDFGMLGFALDPDFRVNGYILFALRGRSASPALFWHVKLQPDSK